MRIASLVAAGLLAVTALVSGLAACSAPDPGAVVFTNNKGRNRNAGGGDGTDPGGDPGTDPEGDADGGGGGGGSGDGGGGGGTPATTAFTGAAAFAAMTGPSTDNAAHGAGNNPQGQNCLSCHGPGTARVFYFGGTVYTTSAGGTPVAGAEVRIRLADGKGLSAYTNAQGNFFLPMNGPGAVPVANGTLVGVRDGTKVKNMVAPLKNAGEGSCSSAAPCHGNGGAKVFLN